MLDVLLITVGLTARIFLLLRMNCCLRASTPGLLRTASFPEASQHLLDLALHLHITQKCHEYREVQIRCGKRDGRKEGKTNEMELEVFYQQKVQCSISEGIADY